MKSVLNGAYHYEKGERFYKLFDNNRASHDICYVFNTENDLLSFVTLASDLLLTLHMVQTRVLFMSYKEFDRHMEKIDKIYNQF